MTAPASEDLRELERELMIAAESGETRRFEDLRVQFAMGHGDLESALGVLREHGKAVEAAPGEWRGPLMDELDRVAPEPARDDGDAPRVQVRVGDGEDEGFDEAIELLERQRGHRATVLAGGPTVRLTRSIVEALDDGAVGQIVKVAVEQAPDDEPFTLEVLP